MNFWSICILERQIFKKDLCKIWVGERKIMKAKEVWSFEIVSIIIKSKNALEANKRFEKLFQPLRPFSARPSPVMLNRPRCPTNWPKNWVLPCKLTHKRPHKHLKIGRAPSIWFIIIITSLTLKKILTTNLILIALVFLSWLPNNLLIVEK